MDEARRLAERGSPEGTVVIAEEQTKGRGRFDRRWTSPPGQDLLFSVVLRPRSDQLCYVNMAATLAVSAAVAEFTGLLPAVKWPNDVRICERKVSGILVEAVVEAGELRHAVVGLGVNVNFDPSLFPEIASTATSLFKETGRRLGRTAVLLAILKRLDDLYRAVRSEESLTARWSAQLETLGKAVRVRWGDEVIEGKAIAVDDQGNLEVLRADGSTVMVVAGEVSSQA